MPYQVISHRSLTRPLANLPSPPRPKVSTEDRRGRVTNRWRLARNFRWALARPAPHETRIDICVVHSRMRPLDPLAKYGANRSGKVGAFVAPSLASGALFRREEVLVFELDSQDDVASLVSELRRRAEHFGRLM